MDRTTTLARLEQEIVRLLQEGITITDDTLFFAESTWGLGPGELLSALADPQFEEREVLRALVLTPSTAVRKTLEPLLIDLSPTGLSTQCLAQAVHKQLKTLTIHVVGESPLPIKAGLADIEYFIDKLYLCRTIDDLLNAALAELFPEETVSGQKELMGSRG